MRAHRRTIAGLALGFALATLGGTSAQAQGDARGAISRCRALPTETERLDCMEGLVLDLSSPAPPSVQASPGGDAVEPEAPSAPDAREAERDSSGDGRRRLLGLSFGRRSAEPAAAGAGGEPEAYGAERLQADDGERSRPEPMTARVVGFEEAAYQRLRVELDNGQVWEQRDGVPPWREEQYGAPDEVEIFPSRFGGYRMRLVGKNLTLGVERVR